MGGDRIYLGDGDRMTVEAYGLEGAHLLSVRADMEQPKVTEDQVTRWIEATLSHPVYLSRPDAAERARSRFLKAPVHAEMPAHTELLVDSKERLWVKTYAPPWEEGNEWWVFDSDGRWLEVVLLPPGLQVFEIGYDFILGLRKDEFDVEYVELYELRERG